MVAKVEKYNFLKEFNHISSSNKRQEKKILSSIYLILSQNYIILSLTATDAVVHLNFRAGSTIPVPVFTVSPGHYVNKADTQ